MHSAPCNTHTPLREIRVRFGHLDRPEYDVTINGKEFPHRKRKELEASLIIKLPTGPMAQAEDG